MQHHRTSALIPLMLFWLLPLAAAAQTEDGYESDESVPEHVRSNEEEPDHHRLRQEWLESLHRCEPGLNWRAIDRENRRAIGTVRAKALGKRAPRGMQGVPDTIPGVISGTWAERGSSNLAGRIRHADVDLERGIIYAASDGGTIWRGTLEGKEWRPLNDTLRMPVISMLKVLPRAGGGIRLAAMTEYPVALYLSDDDGLSWLQRSRGLDMLTSTGLSKKGVVLNDSSRTIYLLGMETDPNTSGSVSVLYRSTDGCESFTRILRHSLSMTQIDIWAPEDGGELLMLHRDTLSRIRPDGTMTTIGRVPAGQYYHGGDLTGTSAGGKLRLYAVIEELDSARWYVSLDTGRSWSRGGGAPYLFSHNGIAASRVDAGSVFSGAVNFYRSQDSGRSFMAVSSVGDYYYNPESRLHADIFGVHPFIERDGSEFILICTDGGIYISRDTLRTVRNISMQGLNVSQYYSVLTSRRPPYVCNAGSQDQGFQRSTEGGTGLLEFSQVVIGDFGSLTSSDSGRTIWSNYPGITTLITENEQGEVQPFRSTVFRGRRQHWISPLVADVQEPLMAYLAAADQTGNGSYLWQLDARSIVIQSTRLPFNFAAGGSGNISSVAISPVEPSRWYVITEDGRFFRSEDAGANWEMTDKSVGGGFYRAKTLLPSAIDPRTIYVAGSGYSAVAVRVSTDGGRTFTAISDGLPQTLVYDLAADPEERHLFAATEVGPFVYSMAHRRWYYMGGANAPEQAYTSVEYLPATRTVRFATYGRGIWDFVADKGASVERAEVPAPLPALALAAAPNPAASATTFLFTMPGAGHATVRVYDLAGQEMATLVDDYLEAGEHAVPWDLRSHGGAPVPSGSYTCVISSAGSIGFTRLDAVR